MRFILLFLIPIPVSASVLFSEIMYDPEGADTGREWVEVWNNGGDGADMTGWKFFEEGTNHGLVLNSGSAVVPPGGYAIISDDPTKFKTDFPNYSGTVFDSSFSLKNTGEELTLKDGAGAIYDSIIYDTGLGGGGDGNSLSRDETGSFGAGTPTPGGPYKTQANTTPTETTTTTQSQSGSGSTSYTPIPEILVEAGRDKIVIVGAESSFSGNAYGLDKKPIDNARFVWNFGDGVGKDGKIVGHTYQFPGDYIVVLDVSSGDFSGTDRLRVKAENSPVSITRTSDGGKFFVELGNSSNSDIDIGKWMISLDGKSFLIPTNTFIPGGKRIIFANEITGLLVRDGSVPSLLYPNGVVSVTYSGIPVLDIRAPATPNVSQSQIVSTKPKTNLVVSEATAQAISSVEGGDNSTKKHSLIPWLSGVLGIVIVSIIGLFFIYKKPANEPDDIDEEARGYEITEAK